MDTQSRGIGTVFIIIGTLMLIVSGISVAMFGSGGYLMGILAGFIFLAIGVMRLKKH